LVPALPADISWGRKRSFKGERQSRLRASDDACVTHDRLSAFFEGNEAEIEGCMIAHGSHAKYARLRSISVSQ
jgi:hypothetical protein